MKASICIAAYEKPHSLQAVLKSIYKQKPSFDFETIVVDDGGITNLESVCKEFPVVYSRIDRDPGYRNPAIARNQAYRLAKGEVIIAQSDDVIHHSENCIETLVGELTQRTFVIATVINVDNYGRPYSDPKGKGYGDKLREYTSPRRKRPLFFLGSLYRKDLYAVGGNDEEFVDPSREDVWFALCLTKGLGLKPYYSANIIGYHRHHAHCEDYQAIERSHLLFREKLRSAEKKEVPWEASGGPWT